MINEKLGIILKDTEDTKLSEALYTYFTEVMVKEEGTKVIKPKDAIDWLKSSFNSVK
jgi:hypothetical protein